MVEKLEYDCPRCVDERLTRVMGRLLICPSCDFETIEVDNTPGEVNREIAEIHQKLAEMSERRLVLATRLMELIFDKGV